MPSGQILVIRDKTLLVRQFCEEKNIPYWFYPIQQVFRRRTSAEKQKRNSPISVASVRKKSKKQLYESFPQKLKAKRAKQDWQANKELTHEQIELLIKAGVINRKP